MNNKYIFMISLFIIPIASCKDEPISENSIFIKEKIGRKIQFPKHAEALYADNFLYDSTFVFNAPVKIITYIDFGCSYCYKELNEYKSFLAFFDKNKISLIVYGSSNTSLSGFYAFIENNPNFPYPIFIDKQKEYLINNNIPQNNKIVQTFLIDNSGTIHVVGNPFANKAIKELFTNEIKKMLHVK